MPNSTSIIHCLQISQLLFLHYDRVTYFVSILFLSLILRGGGGGGGGFRGYICDIAKENIHSMIIASFLSLYEIEFGVNDLSAHALFQYFWVGR